MRRRSIQRQNRPLPPIGLLAALMTASGVTLLCVCFGVAPFDILIRAAGSALIMGIIVSFGASVIQLANEKNRSNRHSSNES